MVEPSDNEAAPRFSIPVESEALSAAPSWATGDAKNEDKRWDHLEDTKRRNDQRWLAVYGWILLAITIVFALTFLGALLAWAWHYMAPSCWHWLEDYQLGKIQSVLFSGGMGAVISGIIRAQMGKTQ